MSRRERLRSTFWYIPTLFIVASVGLALVMHQLDDALAARPGDAPWSALDAGTATTVLSTIAAAMLTFVGVVFSITLVALQLASSQLSPRVLRSFVRSPVPKIAFGTFIATFLYSLILLAQTSDAASAQVPVLGTSVALLLVGASVGIFVVYVNATVRQMQVSEVISRVASETRRAIAENHPGPEHYVDATLPELAGPSGVLQKDPTIGRGRAKQLRGVLLGSTSPASSTWPGPTTR